MPNREIKGGDVGKLIVSSAMALLLLAGVAGTAYAGHPSHPENKNPACEMILNDDHRADLPYQVKEALECVGEVVP